MRLAVLRQQRVEVDVLLPAARQPPIEVLGAFAVRKR
jgi:hypothetical protein